MAKMSPPLDYSNILSLMPECFIRDLFQGVNEGFEWRSLFFPSGPFAGRRFLARHFA
jgi:hypothetical protein